MTKLADSYRTALAKIITTGCIWEEGQNGWYHVFDKAKVKARTDEIKSEIIRLEKTTIHP